MGIVSIFGLLMLFYAIKSTIKIFFKKDYSGKGLVYILLFGSMAFIWGVLGQAIGMFGAFAAIQEAGDISPGLIAGGFRVSMIAPLYGAFYFIISIPIWVVLREKVKNNTQK
jgi:biopolymer transport protein ExbB/TolQ